MREFASEVFFAFELFTKLIDLKLKLPSNKSCHTLSIFIPAETQYSYSSVNFKLKIFL